MNKNGFYVKSDDYHELKEAVQTLQLDSSQNKLFFKVTEDEKLSAWKWLSKLNHSYKTEKAQEVGVLNQSFLTIFLVINKEVKEKFVVRGLRLVEHFSELISSSFEPLSHTFTIKYDEMVSAPILINSINCRIYEPDIDAPDNLDADVEWKTITELDIPGDLTKVLEFQ